MPLEKSSSQSAFRSNYKTLLKDGYKRDQALAISYSVQGKARKKGSKRRK